MHSFRTYETVPSALSCTDFSYYEAFLSLKLALEISFLWANSSQAKVVRRQGANRIVPT